MIDRTRQVSTRPDDFPGRLGAWLAQYDDLLGGIVLLRRLPDGAAAVDAVLAVREITTVRLSWELWEALVLGEGDDPDPLLLGRIPLASLEQAHLAFYGVEISDAPDHLSLVQPG